MKLRKTGTFISLFCLVFFCRGAQADISGCALFAADNIWNVAVDSLPVHPNSDAYVAAIGAHSTLHPDFGAGVWPPGSDSPIGIPYTVVPGSQPEVAVTFDYADESDPGPYPIPPGASIEGGPNSDGDRHVLVLDRDNCVIYELFDAWPQGDGSWEAGSGAVFDLASHALRPEGWTSADAAGLPILPGLVRYGEVTTGEISHALRFTAPQTGRAYVWPGRHYASSLTGAQYPPMGQRFRLKASVDISGFSSPVQAILKALKTYGMMLADNGSSWYLSGVPDERWDNDVLRELRLIKGSDFEAVDVSSLTVDKDSGRTRAENPIIIDHTCTDISVIPDIWIERAKQLKIHYAHTSHGSQVTSGVENLETLDAFYSFARRTSGSEGLPPAEDPHALRMYDGNPPDTYIGPEDYWATADGRNRTRAVADTGSYGFSMWSWCGQVSDAAASYIQSYLDAMHQFETEYPDMRFIYMTGHLDGTGPAGNLHLRNEQIRSYCRDNNKVLFDFADIERFDPDGNDFLGRGGNDGCNYGDGNWADQWCAANQGSDLCATCDCAHSEPLNCNQKGRAFWWMMARLAGWPGPGQVADFTAEPRTGDLPLAVQFTATIPGEATSWIWEFGDGTAGSGPNPSHTYTTAGIYTVALKAATAGGSYTETKSGHITVYPCGNLPVRIEGTGLHYPSIRAAYDLADDMDVILVQALTLPGPLVLDRDIEVELSGGYGCAYVPQPLGMACIREKVALENGTVVMGKGGLCISD